MFPNQLTLLCFHQPNAGSNSYYMSTILKYYLFSALKDLNYLDKTKAHYKSKTKAFGTYHCAWYAINIIDGYRNHPDSWSLPSLSMPKKNAFQGAVWNWAYKLVVFKSGKPALNGIIVAGIWSFVAQSVPWQFISNSWRLRRLITMTPLAPLFWQFNT